MLAASRHEMFGPAPPMRGLAAGSPSGRHVAMAADMYRESKMKFQLEQVLASVGQGCASFCKKGHTRDNISESSGFMLSAYALDWGAEGSS